MRLLLDTHALLWFAGGDRRLSSRARRRIEDVANDKYLSVASLWEIALKLSLGKLKLAISIDTLVQEGVIESGISLLDVQAPHATAVAHLPWHHRDPFDRMLVAQASAERLTIVSADEVLEAYGVSRVW